MPSQSSRPQLGPSQIYLMIYNTVCAFLWLRILVLVISTLFSPADKDITEAYINLEPWTRCAQTLAVAEIVHAATGITRSPVFTTFTQVFARSVQVWAVNYAFPEVTAPSPAYLAMLLAWSSADVVRYLYFAIMLAGYPIPQLLKWSR
ncbi:hypothetical protein PENSTE_c003G08007 [Penicillium steckii]|uniref:Very-long-chain (3R)-3-hydroxyacyl-CoA dehydratase n=1 Tax=Penicillium steckii TaxID=303698 RepID=A0A1V6TQ47_9EURO|nr:hypothetical protein PENSTE_c003G08007 [Penicillium steckii]